MFEDPNKRKQFFDALGALGQGLTTGNSWQQQLGNANLGLTAHRDQMALKQAESDKINQTVQMLQAQAPELAQAVQSGIMTPSDAYGTFLKKQQEAVAEAAKAKQPDYISVNGLIFDKNSKQWIQPPADMAGSKTEYGLQPIWMKDPKTKQLRLAVPGKDGTLKLLDTPPGLEPLPGVSNVDLGTSIGVRDNRTGDMIKSYPKDVAGAAAANASGKVQGEIKASIPAVESTASTMKEMIKSVKDDPYRARGTGFTSIANSIPATGGYDFQKKVDQLGGQAFLQAIQQMQGFGALSNQEGQTARDAIARLDTAQSEEAFDTALKDLETIIDRGVEKARAMGGVENADPSASTANTPNRTSSGVTWSEEP